MSLTHSLSLVQSVLLFNLTILWQSDFQAMRCFSFFFLLRFVSMKNFQFDEKSSYIAKANPFGLVFFFSFLLRKWTISVKSFMRHPFASNVDMKQFFFFLVFFVIIKVSHNSFRHIHCKESSN